MQAPADAAEAGEGSAPAEPMDTSGGFAYDAAAAAAAANAGVPAHPGCGNPGMRHLPRPSGIFMHACWLM